MTVAKDRIQAYAYAAEPKTPGGDLPWDKIVVPEGGWLSDEPPMESDLHLNQMLLLLACLRLHWQGRQDFYAAGNMTIYYSPRQKKSEMFRGPDFFVVKGTEQKPRNSWVLWDEDGQYPNVIVELLSQSTAATDRGLKKQLYQDVFRTPEYFWFFPQTLEFAGFGLNQGAYQPLVPNGQGWMWSQQLELWLGIQDEQLRFFTEAGELVPTPQELAIATQTEIVKAQQVAEQAQEAAEQAQQAAEQAQQEAEQAQQQATQAQQELAQTKALLDQYQDRFGAL
jgi:Uma2 family endonuclease